MNSCQRRSTPRDGMARSSGSATCRRNHCRSPWKAGSKDMRWGVGLGDVMSEAVGGMVGGDRTPSPTGCPRLTPNTAQTLAAAVQENRAAGVPWSRGPLAEPKEPEPAPVAPPGSGLFPAHPVGVAQLALGRAPFGSRAAPAAESIDLGSLNLPSRCGAVLEDLGGQLGRGLDPLGRLDDRLDLLAPVVVGDAEHRGVADLREAEQDVLDLRPW